MTLAFGCYTFEDRFSDRMFPFDMAYLQRSRINEADARARPRTADFQKQNQGEKNTLLQFHEAIV